MAGLIALNKAFGDQKEMDGLEALSHFWFDGFKDVNPDVFKDGVKRAIQYEQFFPVIVTVRQYVEDVQRRRQAQAPKQIENQPDGDLPSKAWVKALMVKKGLIDADGEWLDRGTLIAEPYLTRASRQRATDTGKTNKRGEKIFRVTGAGGIDPGVKSIFESMSDL